MYRPSVSPSSFSVYGKVREMSKAPVTGVPVEALSEQCEQHQSEAVTGQDGQFRIRGLRPGCSYRVSTKHTAGASNVHCFPSSFTVSMPSADVKGLEMVAAPQDRSTMVAVEVRERRDRETVAFRSTSVP